VQNDPERYEAYVREHFERELARPDSQLTARANRALESNSALRQQYEQQGGRQGFLERMLKGSKKVSVVSVDQGSAPLLSNDHERV
jgi:hypothetical protein